MDKNRCQILFMEMDKIQSGIEKEVVLEGIDEGSDTLSQVETGEREFIGKALSFEGLELTFI
jgi:hypothetical protein